MKEKTKYRNRWRALSRKVDLSPEKEKRVNCITITSLANLRYFFNYNGHSFERFCCGLIGPEGERSALVVPKLDLGKTKRSQADNVFAWDDSEGYKDAFLKAGKSIGIVRSDPVIGCEPSFTLNQMDQFKSVLHAKDYVNVRNEISDLRLLKSADELASVRDSAKRLSKSYGAFEELIRPGMTESMVSFEIMKILEENGLESTDAPLVQSGKNSAIPHSTPGKKRIEGGDIIVVDASAPNSDGYFSDYTRTYVIGRASARQKGIYEIVKRAQEEGIRASKTGNAAENVDLASRTVIEKAGYGEFFVHRTGHGLGLEVHEPPYLTSGNKDRLAKGMVFTVEPGIYLPGKFGIRIEDNVVLSNGEEDVTRISHELVEI